MVIVAEKKDMEAKGQRLMRKGKVQEKNMEAETARRRGNKSSG